MRADLPTGTVTFLFTDIEGSTRLLHDLGAESYAEALAEHHACIRSAIARHAGVEMDTEGDAFSVAFTDAANALAAAAEITEALASTSTHVRIGVHTGTPLVTADGYVGDDVHLGARVAASGHGGQTLVSAATASAVLPGTEPRGLPLVDLGEHRLKDIDGAVSLFQLGAERFPPLRTISNTNLPRPASSFVGRERELAAVLAQFHDGARLVTLTGPGGSGKTRLALEAASTLVPEYRGGVFWVGLSAVRDPGLVTETISHALGAKNGLADHIGERELLLLLDNLEQVIEAAPELSPVLERCPNLTLLVTSRELLRIAGEVEYAVPPLAEPEAVALFCERAKTEPSSEIAELCVRLDALPLAVELAAARARALTPAQILERLSSRLDLLRGGRDAEARQQTLRATIEWSYDLLTPEEQSLFACLSVFAGGCSLEAAEDVCVADVDILQSLVEKSLLRYSGARYWMLETIREYATDRLRASGERHQLGEAQASHFLALAHEAGAELEGPDQAAWLDRLEAEHDNLRAAFDWCHAVGRDEEALRAAVALRLFWDVRVTADEERRRFEQLLSVPQPPELRAAGLRGLASAALRRGDFELAQRIMEERLGLYRALGDERGVNRTLQGLAVALVAHGALDEARAVITPVVAWSRGVSDYELTYPLFTLGQIEWARGSFDEALGILAECLSLNERIGDVSGIAGCCLSIGGVLVYAGRRDEAVAPLSRGVGIARTLGGGGVPLALDVVALSTALAGNPADAARMIGCADRWKRDAGERDPALWDAPRERALAACVEALGPDGFAAACAEGETLSVDEAAELALQALGA